MFEIADRITVLKDGHLVGTVKPQQSDNNQLIKMMVGRTLGEIFPVENPAGTEVALEVNRLSQEGSFSDISFSINVAKFWAVRLGRQRADPGRHECIFGADPISTGEILLNGKPIHPRSPREAVNFGIALLTEDRKGDGLVMNCTIRDNISLASYPRLSKFGVISRDKQATEVKTLIQELDVRPPLLDRLVNHLSGGNQQKVVLAKWLLTHARVMILDEPTRGVDVATKVEIYHIIDKLARSGMCILFISSELPEILGMSDRTLIMREGRLVGEFTRAEASEERVPLFSRRSEGMIEESKPSTSITKKLVDGLRKLFVGNDGNYRRPNWVNYAFLAAFLLLMVVTATMSDVFFTQRNLSNLMRQAVTNGVLSLGMLIVILTGGIDLSVGPIVALTGIMVAGFSNQGLPLWLAILICLGVGTAIGAINGLFYRSI